VTPEGYIKAELARQAHRHGQHVGGTAAMLAMAHMFRNRVRAGMGSWMAVLSNSEAASGTIILGHPYFDITKRENQILLARVDGIYSGSEEDTYTEGSLYYAEMHLPVRPQFQQMVIEQPKEHPRVATVGPVSFFR
jgi:hypothetical protein